MAVIKKDGSTMGLPMNITRGNPIPIDPTMVWYSLTEAQNYAKNDATAYVGQLISVVNENSGQTNVYIISNVAGDLINISSSEPGDISSDETIILYGGSASDVLNEEGD